MILTMISTKGGVGKTTTTANLGAYLSENGFKVLMVDADIQPGLSSHYHLAQRAENGLTHLITKVDVGSVTSNIDVEGITSLDLIYSDDPNGELQNYILHCPDGSTRLRYTLQKLRDEYDFIFIDTQGAAGALLTCAIYAADVLLSPISPDAPSASEFNRGTLRIINESREPGERMGITVGNLHAFFSRVERTSDAEDISEALREQLPLDGVKLLKTQVPAKVAYKRAATKKTPVHKHDRKTGKKYPSGYEVTRDLAEEIIKIKEELENAS